MQVKAVSAHGVVAVHAGIEEFDDVDNALGIVEFWNGKIAQFYYSRTFFAGQEDGAEIIGTKGKVVVSGVQNNMVQCYNSTGASRDIPQFWFDRWEEAFVREDNEFVDYCLGDTRSPISSMKLANAAKAVEIGLCLQEALVTRKRLEFDLEGNRI